MEKHEDNNEGMHPPMRTLSHTWSVEEETSRESPVLDPEEDGKNLELSRTVSTGPPYTIFGPRAKMFIVLSVSVSSLISPFGATTFYPAINVLAKQLHVTPTLMNLALTTYMVSPTPNLNISQLTSSPDRPSNSTSHHSRHLRRQWPPPLLHHLLRDLHRRQHRARSANKLRCPPRPPSSPSRRMQCRNCSCQCCRS